MSLVVVSRTETIPAGGQVYLGGGNFFMLLSAGAAVDVNFYRAGIGFGADGVLGGYVTGKVDAWDRVIITGTPGGSVTYFHGYESITEDFTDYRRTVGIFQAQQPASQFDAPDVDVGGSAVAVLVRAANGARAKITITNLDTSLANVRVGTSVVAAARGQRLTPGQSVTITAVDDVYAIRETAAAALVSVHGENF